MQSEHLLSNYSDRLHHNSQDLLLQAMAAVLVQLRVFCLHDRKTAMKSEPALIVQLLLALWLDKLGSPKGTWSSLFQEQSTTASPLAPISSLSSFDTQHLPLGLKITPGKGTPSRSSETTFCLTNFVPVQRFLSHCPRSHIDSLKGMTYAWLVSSLPSGDTELLL